jgi:arsenite transporter
MAARKPQAKCTLVIQRLLWRISDNGRMALIAGLMAGLALPGLAAAMQPWLPQMVAGLLTITALRIGHQAVTGVLDDLRWGIASVLVLQLGLPLTLLTACSLAGVAETPAALAMVLATSAPAISGAANLALMLRQDAGRMMQIFVLGTALFPLTVLPLFVLMPQLGDPQVIAMTALRLLGVILLATALGFALRAVLFPAPTEGQIKALDGLSVFAFSAIVVGLMAALNPALKGDPLSVLLWAALAFAISYCAQALAHRILSGSPLAPLAGPLAIGAGNRNIALFLVALPEHLIAPLLVFIGCWQLPMYLTPVLMRWLYRPEA